MRILAINTISDVMTVGVVTEKEFIYESVTGEKSVYSSTINDAVKRALLKSRTEFNELDAYSVVIGPGSFTGIRVGIATIKGYCFAVEKPIICINSLALAAYNISGECEVVMDAGKGRVYRGVFLDGEEKVKPEMQEKLSEPGEGTRVFFDMQIGYAQSLAGLSKQAFEKGDFCEKPAPLYLRLCQAEEERAKKELAVLRRITEKDVEDIAQAEKEMFAAEAWSENVVRETVHSMFNDFIGAYQGDLLLGYISVEVGYDQAYICNVAVKPPFRRKGVARLLLSKEQESLKERGVRSVVLDVRASNSAAIALYENAGFGIVCRRKRFYGDEDGFTMAKNL